MLLLGRGVIAPTISFATLLANGRISHGSEVASPLLLFMSCVPTLIAACCAPLALATVRCAIVSVGIARFGDTIVCLLAPAALWLSPALRLVAPVESLFWLVDLATGAALPPFILAQPSDLPEAFTSAFGSFFAEGAGPICATLLRAF